MEAKKSHIYIGTTVGIVSIGVVVGFYLYQRKKKNKYQFDERTQRLLMTLVPSVRKKAIKMIIKARKRGIDLRLISAHRDCEEQNALFAKGRTKKGKIVTKAKCGQSSHNYGRGLDAVEFVNEKPIWENPNEEIIGEIGESVGLEWGGRWKSFIDVYHFQDLAGRKLSDLYKKYLRTGELAV